MTQQHKDILTVIERHGPISTSEICEYLSTLGYGGAMAWQDFRGSVSKQLCYLRDKGDIAGEDKPQAKGKPMRVWALAETQEMASDVAEVEATIQENLTVADADMVATLDSLDTEREIQERQAVAETVTPEPVSAEVKVEHRPRLSAEQLIQGYKDAGSQGNMLVFAAGVAFAEKHHGISQ